MSLIIYQSKWFEIRSLEKKRKEIIYFQPCLKVTPKERSEKHIIQIILNSNCGAL
jgi:hypothetical protein